MAASAGPEIERLISLLSKLPGLGPRSARRAALALLKKRDQLLSPLADALAEAARAHRVLLNAEDDPPWCDFYMPSIVRRGRLVLMTGFLGLALTLMTAFGGLAIATHDSGTPEQVRVLQVAPGDTLYDIAMKMGGI